jgi:hypothetical protein
LGGWPLLWLTIITECITPSLRPPPLQRDLYGVASEWPV